MLLMRDHLNQCLVSQYRDGTISWRDRCKEERLNNECYFNVVYTVKQCSNFSILSSDKMTPECSLFKFDVICCVPCLNLMLHAVYLVQIWCFMLCTLFKSYVTCGFPCSNLMLHGVYLVQIWCYMLCTLFKSEVTWCVPCLNLMLHVVYLVQIWSYMLCSLTHICCHMLCTLFKSDASCTCSLNFMG